jgi:hypothetical protein
MEFQGLQFTLMTALNDTDIGINDMINDLEGYIFGLKIKKDFTDCLDVDGKEEKE